MLEMRSESIHVSLGVFGIVGLNLFVLAGLLHEIERLYVVFQSVNSDLDFACEPV